MRRASAIEKESVQITTVQDLTGVFESISSTQVAKVKSKVELSKQFFQLLWTRYNSIRIDPTLRITNRDLGEKGNDKKVFVVISAEAGLSGDIDQRLIETMVQSYDPKTTDIVVLGTHGANQLTQRGIKFQRYFQVPETDKYIDVSPVIGAVQGYSQVVVYYEEYVSLGVQEIKKIDLISTMREMGEDAEDNTDIMTDQDTIFEPSIDVIADEMEQTMMTLALSQTILESTLAQAASRFNAMVLAKKRATELLLMYKLEFHRAKRGESDRRLREVMVSLKKKRKRERGSA
ncbi:MAG TPA: F0F1 ATP synthase subunit gamma [Candidatus Saccharimonadales bacterium]|nr:F0F1 ATP synthase subunit gamma [Candidatus Saccharimonadales bacterium]